VIDNIDSKWLISCNNLQNIKKMKSRLLKMALAWVAPIVIGYIAKKVEEKFSKKSPQKEIPVN